MAKENGVTLAVQRPVWDADHRAASQWRVGEWVLESGLSECVTVKTGQSPSEVSSTGMARSRLCSGDTTLDAWCRMKSNWEEPTSGETK